MSTKFLDGFLWGFGTVLLGSMVIAVVLGGDGPQPDACACDTSANAPQREKVNIADAGEPDGLNFDDAGDINWSPAPLAIDTDDIVDAEPSFVTGPLSNPVLLLPNGDLWWSNAPVDNGEVVHSVVAGSHTGTGQTTCEYAMVNGAGTQCQNDNCPGSPECPWSKP